MKTIQVTPFQWIGYHEHGKALGLFTILTLISIIIGSVSGVDVRTPVAPMGVLSYEFAGLWPETSAEQVVAAWDEAQKASVAFSLGLGFFFLVGYSHTIGLACILTARRLNRFSRVAFLVALLQLTAAA